MKKQAYKKIKRARKLKAALKEISKSRQRYGARTVKLTSAPKKVKKKTVRAKPAQKTKTQPVIQPTTYDLDND